MNINNIKWDLKETKTVDFENMMKMFLIRNRLNISTRADIDGLRNSAPLMGAVNADYKQLLQQAIDFCNLDLEASDPTNKDRRDTCKYVKQQMRAL